MTEETQKKISQLQLMEQNIQALLNQKQQFQQKLVEVDSALKELAETDKAYKIIGNIMVMKQKKKLEEELQQTKELLAIRIKNVEKQENQIRDKAKKIQGEVLSTMQ